MTKKSTTNIGSTGEYLVAADLSRQGLSVTVVSSNLPYDLIVEHSNKLYRVQVKATSNKERGLYLFRTKGSNHRDYDVIAFVAICSTLISYFPFFKANDHNNFFNHPSNEYSTNKYPVIGSSSFESAIKCLVDTCA